MNQNEKLIGENILDKPKEEEESDIIKNIKGDDIDYNSSQLSALLEQQIENLKNDRKLKIITQRFIKIILSICVGFTLALIGVNALVKSVWNKELYSEWFLSVLIGSQLIILPFSLLYIVAKHLFPNQDKDIR